MEQTAQIDSNKEKEMNEKKKDPRWKSFFQGVFLWFVAGVCGYGLVLTRGLIPGSCLTEAQATFLELNQIFLVVIAILGSVGGLYNLYEALKEND